MNDSSKDKFSVVLPPSDEQATRARVSSEIESTKQPYKEIEIIINNNRMILRIQKLSPSTAVAESTEFLDYKSRHATVTSSFPDNLNLVSNQPSNPVKLDERQISNDNREIFLLKIRKRSEMWDKRKEFIDLELKTLRPWIPKPVSSTIKPLKKIDEKPRVIIEKQSDIIEQIIPQLPQKLKRIKKVKKKRKKKKSK